MHMAIHRSFQAGYGTAWDSGEEEEGEGDSI